MKALAFTDLHASVSALKKVKAKIKKNKPDIVFCLGDFTIFEQNIKPVLEKINKLGPPVLLIHGNHEMSTIVKRLCKPLKNIEFIHKAIVDVAGWRIIGHGGGGFYGTGRKAKDPDFDKFIKKHVKKIRGKMILLTHAPPYKTKLDYLDWWNEHVGCLSYTNFIKKYKPKLALSGHIHETFGAKQKIGSCLLNNPGPEGKMFRFTGDTVVLMRTQ